MDTQCHLGLIIAVFIFGIFDKAVLSGSCRNSTQVGCVARVLSAPQREVIHIIPDDDDDDGLDEKSGSNHRSLGIRISVILSPVLLVACGCVAAFVFVQHMKKPQSSRTHRELQMNEIPETTSRHTQETQTPSGSQESREVREETPEGNQQNNDQMLLSGTVRRLSFD